MHHVLNPWDSTENLMEINGHTQKAMPSISSLTIEM